MTNLAGFWKFYLCICGGLLLTLCGSGVQGQLSGEEEYSFDKINNQLNEAEYLRSREKKPLEALKIYMGLLRNEQEFEADSLLRFKLYNSTSRVFNDMRLEKERGVYLKKSLNIIPKKNYPDPLREYFLWSDLAGHYMKEGQKDSALVCYRLAKQNIYGVNNGRRYTQKIASLNNLGIFFAKSEELDSAAFYYGQALEGYMDSVSLDTGLWLAINDNLAENSVEKAEYDRALELYDQNLNLTQNYRWGIAQNKQNRWLKTTLGKVGVLKLQRKEREALAILQELETNLRDSKMPVPLQANLEIHHRFKELYEATGQVNLALQYSSKVNTIQEAMFSKNQLEHNKGLRIMAEFNVDAVEEKLAIEQEEAEIKLALSRTQALIRLLVFVFIALIVIGIMVFIWVRRRRIQIEQDERLRIRQALMRAELRQKELERDKLSLEVQNEQNEKSRIELELKYKQKDLETLALDISRKKEWAERLLDFTRSLRNMKEVDRLLSLSDLESEIRSQLRTAERQQVFQEKVDLVNHEFYQALGQRFPKMTNAEKELSGFIRMKLTNSEIGSLRNISDSSVRTARYRLRKKMALTKDQDLDLFIENLTNPEGTDMGQE